MSKIGIIANEKDNVATVVSSIEPGNYISIEIATSENLDIEAKNKIPSFHKVALVNIKKGDPIIKYGEIIGQATKDIYKGNYVHVHNVESNRGRGDIQKSKTN